jgi:methylated-DNA-[protein]-cysteine S-methyltransferase
MVSFREKVYNIVRKIQEGKALTYKKVAKLAGKPRAFRAVGNILNRNPDLNNIPCHRVIKSDRKIGGYRFGAKRKAALLKQEGVVVKKGRVDL